MMVLFVVYISYVGWDVRDGGLGDGEVCMRGNVVDEGVSSDSILQSLLKPS